MGNAGLGHSLQRSVQAVAGESGYEFGRHGLPDDPLAFAMSPERNLRGALFWLTADIEIRKRTDNKRGVQDAIRAILVAGGTLSVEWSPERALGIGDQAIGVPVLKPLFATWRQKAVSPDLDALWKSLGVARSEGRTTLLNEAPLAHIRNAITAQPATPLLLRAPAMLYEAAGRP